VVGIAHIVTTRRQRKMKEELDKALVKDFPILYQQRYDDMRTTCMYWGFSCGDGWEPLIRRLSEKLEAWNNKHPDKAVVATQVKEKFGTLRFYHFIHIPGSRLWELLIMPLRYFMFSQRLGKPYWRIVDIRRKLRETYYKKIDKLVCVAEEESAKTCEDCGRPGRLRGKGWVVTLSDQCWNEYRGGK